MAYQIRALTFVRDLGPVLKDLLRKNIELLVSCFISQSFRSFYLCFHVTEAANFFNFANYVISNQSYYVINKIIV